MLFMSLEWSGANDCANVINYERKWNYFISKTNLNKNFSIYLAAHCNNQQCIVRRAACVSVKITGKLEIKERSIYFRVRLLEFFVNTSSGSQQTFYFPQSTVQFNSAGKFATWRRLKIEPRRVGLASFMHAIFHDLKHTPKAFLSYHASMSILHWCSAVFITPNKCFGKSHLRDGEKSFSPPDDVINLSCVRCEASVRSFIIRKRGWGGGEEGSKDEAKGKELMTFVCADVSEKESEHFHPSCDLTKCGFALSPFIIEIHFSFYAFLNPTKGRQGCFIVENHKSSKFFLLLSFSSRNLTHPNNGRV